MSEHSAWVPKHAFCLSDHWKAGGVGSGAHVVGYPRKKGRLYVYWGGNVVRLLIFRERDHDGSSISLSPLWQMDFGRAPLVGSSLEGGSERALPLCLCGEQSTWKSSLKRQKL